MTILLSSASTVAAKSINSNNLQKTQVLLRKFLSNRYISKTIFQNFPSSIPLLPKCHFQTFIARLFFQIPRFVVFLVSWSASFILKWMWPEILCLNPYNNCTWKSLIHANLWIQTSTLISQPSVHQNTIDQIKSTRPTSKWNTNKTKRN